MADLRPYLFSIAYRMLGTVSEAEDVVQEAYVRLTGAGPIEQPKAYAAKVTTRLAIDTLRSARVRRESYVGPWLPEPLLTSGPDADPAHRIEMDDSVSTAFLVLMESLSPLERAAYVLREGFDYSYGELAQVLERSEASCRQLVARARAHIEERRPRFEPDVRRRDELARAFLAASETGDLKALEALLAEDVQIFGDGGGKAAAVVHPVSGNVQVARFLLGLMRQAKTRGWVLRVVEVNGQPGFAVDDSDGRLLSVLALQIADSQVQTMHSVANPDKLRHLGPVAG